MKKVIFYFDGFNFYNGLKQMSGLNPEWKKFYWLDFVKFCNNFLPETQTLVKVKYFTAVPLNLNKAGRQSALFGANKIENGDLFQTI